MHSFISFMLIILSIFNGVFHSAAIKFNDCGGENAVGHLRKLKVSPQPASLRDNVTVSAEIDYLIDVPKDSIVKLKLYRQVIPAFKIPFFSAKTKPVEVKIPCVRGLGSCESNLCPLDKLPIPIACNFIKKVLDTNECSCGQMKKGRYNANNVVFEVPQVSSFLALITSGHYRAYWELLSRDKRTQLACVELEFDIRS